MLKLYEKQGFHLLGLIYGAKFTAQDLKKNYISEDKVGSTSKSWSKICWRSSPPLRGGAMRTVFLASHSHFTFQEVEGFLE